MDLLRGSLRLTVSYKIHGGMAERFTKTMVIVLFALMLATVESVDAQTVESMKTILETKAAYTAEDFESIDEGEIVVKRLASGEKREVAVCGLVRINLPFDVVLEGFRLTINQQKKSTAKDFGRFGIPPASGDLDDLEFDGNDIAGLQNCRVGNCSWTLPSSMIKRLQSEVDWEAPDRDAKASALIKAMLLEYVTQYFEQGDAALIEYNDKPGVLRLEDEYRSLRSTLFWSDEFVPEFRDYFENFPAGRLNGVENTASWAKIKVGLKPVVMFTHNINYKKKSNGVSQALIVSKQIYANHYFDSTLGLTVIAGFPKKNGRYETYVIFLNRSRARALSGRIGNLVQKIVEGQGVDRVRTVLYETRQDSSRVFANRQGAATVEEKSFIDRLGEYQNYIAVILFVLFAIAGYLFIRWRYRNP